MRGSVHRIEAVDGLRGVAFLLVTYQHVYSHALRDAVSRKLGIYPWVIGHGWMGVNVFFILSGFVLALPFFTGSARMETHRDVWRFYVRRSKRLLPLFFFMSLVSFAFTVQSNAPAIRSLVLTISTGSMLTSSEFFPTINGPLWSLAIEIWFSIFFPFLLIAIAKFGVSRTIVVIAILSLAIRVVGTYLLFTGVNASPIKDSVLGRLDDFAIGAVIAQLYAKSLLPKLRSRYALLGVAIIALAGALWDVNEDLPRATVSLFNIVVQCGVALVLITSLNPDTRAASVLSIWPLRLAGAMCFSLYCWHALLINHALLVNPFNLVNQLTFWLPLAALSAVTYRYIEFPRSDLADIFQLGEQTPVSLPSRPQRRQDFRSRPWARLPVSMGTRQYDPK
jgi:peptidoglycan/LPS O-acetylase OafA/YrhL